MRALKHNWAKGARLAFLESYIDDYKTGLLTKKAPAVLDGIVNAWFGRFHWTVPLSAESDLPGITLPVGPDGREILSKENKKIKAEVVERTRTVRIFGNTLTIEFNDHFSHCTAGSSTGVRRPSSSRAVAREARTRCPSSSQDSWDRTPPH